MNPPTSIFVGDDKASQEVCSVLSLQCAPRCLDIWLVNTVGLGARIRQLRAQLELTQEELAEAAGISRDGLARIERNDRSPTFNTVAALAHALGVPLAELWGSGPVRPSTDLHRSRRIERALKRVPSAFAETIVQVVEQLCEAAGREGASEASGARRSRSEK